MAIAFDAAGKGDAGSGTSLTYSHTCTGSNLMLLVGILDGSTGSVTAVTYNSVAMTKINDFSFGTQHVYLYGLINPSTGTNSVSITRSTNTNGLYARSTSYTGVNQSTQPDTSTTNSAGSTTSLSSSITPIASGTWAVMYGLEDNSGSLTAGTGSTKRSNSTTIGDMFDSNGVVTAGSPYSMAFSGGSGNYGAILATILPTAIGDSNLLTMGIS